jgi:hypothetical protein
MKLLHYCSYWGTWSRVICPYTHEHGVIELNLTPVNPGFPHSWAEQIEPIIFRHHGTQLGRRDIWGYIPLPEDWKAFMVEKIGEELTNRLLTEDWLPLLDIPKVKWGQPRGGGISFQDCKKG